MSRTLDYRRFQEYVHTNRLKRLLCASAPVWWNDTTEKKFLKRYYYGSVFHKKQSRRKIRHIKLSETPGKGNISNKYYDYWWNVT